MNKVIIVSKTHLDLGFTNLAAEVFSQYIDDFIPTAIEIARAVNSDGKKFVWTLGSWIVNEALEKGSAEQRENLAAAIARGDIAVHACPFTTHTELIDEESYAYGLSIVKALDVRFGRKTIAAKMTDVPGHTAALVPLLAKAGIKLLHIGVNGASAMPDVPPCFLWKFGGSEIVVIYDGSYGGEHRNAFIGDILYFDHSLDNCGPRDAKGVIDNYNHIKSLYPGYEVVAGTLDDYARLLWAVKDQLPVITSEIGDTWIHGAASDPYKMAAMRTLADLREQWVSDGSLTRESGEYRAICNSILCIAEHTWGLDTKWVFGDYDNYLRRDFDEARAKDMKIRRGGIYSLPFAGKLREKGAQGVYSTIEKGWEEQRGYIDDALAAMTHAHCEQAQAELARLRPQTAWVHAQEQLQTGKAYASSSFEISVNDFGGIGSLKRNGSPIIRENDRPLLEYRSYGNADYDYWLHNYTRDYKMTRGWAVGDFARPKYQRVDKKFPHGVFAYRAVRGSVFRAGDALSITVDLNVDAVCSREMGAPERVQIRYLLDGETVQIQFQWFDKPANRLTESLSLCFYPAIDGDSLRLIKCGVPIDPLDVVKNGGRKLSAAQCCHFTANGQKYRLKNRHSPIVSSGCANILHFDNAYNDYAGGGISFILHDNVWGTNFPLWYGENAYFAYELEPLES